MKNIFTKLIPVILVVIFIFSFSACSDEESSAKEDNSSKTNQANLIKDSQLDKSTYKLGDIMGDYTVTDVNGKTYSFSELLKEKKAIVLNFWFINCGPCQMEFPYLQKAADKYSDDIAVIAINPTLDKEKAIIKYAKQNELTLPLVKGEDAWNNAFSLKGYPTTVVIDRYGKVSFKHIGAITQDGEFEKIFKFFADEKYKHTIINDINEFKE